LLRNNVKNTVPYAELIKHLREKRDDELWESENLEMGG
jgi:hypothetical protein